MKLNNIIEILENEINCIKAAEYCTRECNKCCLVKDSKDILTALNITIQLIGGSEYV